MRNLLKPRQRELLVLLIAALLAGGALQAQNLTNAELPSRPVGASQPADRYRLAQDSIPSSPWMYRHRSATPR